MIRRFQIYRDFDLFACYDCYFGSHSYWETLRACYDQMVTSGDLRGDYMVTIKVADDTLIVADDADWVIAFLKWAHV